MIFDWRTELNRYHRYFVDLKGFSEKKNVRSFTSLILTLLTISFFTFFAIKPTLVIIAKLVREIKDKREINLVLKNKIASLVKAQEEYSLNQDRFYLANEALPETSEFPLLILAMEKEASESGLQIQSLSINKIEVVGARSKDEKSKKQEIPSFEFSLTLVGDFEKLQYFLTRFTTLRRINNLENVTFTQSKLLRSEEMRLSLNISGKANFYPTIKGSNP